MSIEEKYKEFVKQVIVELKDLADRQQLVPMGRTEDWVVFTVKSGTTDVTFNHQQGKVDRVDISITGKEIECDFVLNPSCEGFCDLEQLYEDKLKQLGERACFLINK